MWFLGLFLALLSSLLYLRDIQRMFVTDVSRQLHNLCLLSRQLYYFVFDEVNALIYRVSNFLSLREMKV